MILVERLGRGRDVRGARRVLVVGAGSGGQMVVRELQLNPNLGARAIGFLDDDPRKRGHARCTASTSSAPPTRSGEILDEFNPDEVIIAIPSAPGVLRGRVVTACRERDIPVRTLPDGLRAPPRRRPAHPPAARGPGRGRARPRPGDDGARPGRRLPPGQGRPGHRRRRLDRLRARSARSPGSARSCWSCSTTPRTTSSGSTARWSRSGTSPGSSRCSPTARRATGCSR